MAPINRLTSFVLLVAISTDMVSAAPVANCPQNALGTCCEYSGGGIGKCTTSGTCSGFPCDCKDNSDCEDNKCCDTSSENCSFHDFQSRGDGQPAFYACACAAGLSRDSLGVCRELRIGCSFSILGGYCGEQATLEIAAPVASSTPDGLQITPDPNDALTHTDVAPWESFQTYTVTDGNGNTATCRTEMVVVGNCEDPGKICCDDKTCKVPNSSGACGDPHMTGFLGQKFDFTGEDGAWYCLVNDGPSMHLNMRVTAPVPALPQITYITGLAVITTDVQGVEHTIEITVADPHNLDSECSYDVSPCLADGALTVKLDGQESLVSPEEVTLGPGVAISAVNLPGSCRSFGFEKYWEQKKLQNAGGGRKLDVIGFMQDMGEWILADPTATNMAECAEYVAAVGTTGLFELESEHASFQIMTPVGTIRLSHGRLHQLAMRDPTDQFNLPDHLTWQMNVAIDHHDVSLEATGVLGETVVPTVDANGKYIMKGLDAIRGSQEDYRVAGPLETAFAQGHH